MSFLLGAVTALHGLVLVLLFVATLDKAWWVLPPGEPLNLWFSCTYENSTRSWACAGLGHSPPLRGVQGLMVGSLLLSGGSFVLFLWRLHRGPPRGHFVFVGGGQLLAGLAALLGAGLYSAHGPRPPGGHFGHCFVLAWLGGALALVNGVTYLCLRKRE